MKLETIGTFDKAWISNADPKNDYPSNIRRSRQQLVYRSLQRNAPGQ